MTAAREPLEILTESDDFCVINKPSGSVVHKTAGAESSLVLLQTLRDQTGRRVYPVHRLDNATSGCLLFAYSSEAAAGLQKALQEQSCRKTYLALARGKIHEEGIFDRPLTSEKGVRQEALTHYRPIRLFDDTTLLELEIKTGRRHQIRRHLAHAGHHVVGDVNYGKGWLNRGFRERFDFHRMFLHCSRLGFSYKAEINVECPLPLELSALLHKLEETKKTS